MARTLPLRCPICKKLVESSDAEFPFCSERCRTEDLGRWATGQYVVSESASEAAEESDAFAPPEPDED